MFGRGAMTRAATDASSGKTWYLFASATNFSRSSLTFSGYFAATFSLWLKSVFQVVEIEHLVVQRIGVGRAEGVPGRTIDLRAEEPAVVEYNPHWPIISKYWVLCRDAALALAASKV